MRVASDDIRTKHAAIGQLNANGTLTCDNVIVGENEPVWCEDDARPGAVIEFDLGNRRRHHIDSVDDRCRVRIEEFIVTGWSSQCVVRHSVSIESDRRVPHHPNGQVGLASGLQSRTISVRVTTFVET